MNTYPANVLIHVDTTLEIDEMAALQGALGHIPGVGHASPSAHPRLVRVDYDPLAVKAKSILHQVQQRGHSAQLIGA